MDLADFPSALQQLVVRFRAWDEAHGAAPDDDDDAALPRADRAALLDEIQGLVSEHVGPAVDSWRGLREFFSPRASTPACRTCTTLGCSMST